VKIVAVVPVAGVAWPALSDGLDAGFGQPPLAAQADAGASMVAMTADESASRRTMVRALLGSVG
jgi:hypothetical protein